MDGMKAEQLTLGRMEILTDAEYINEDNLINELDRALVAHRVNRSNIQYRWNYYRGRQDIQYKTKIVRPEINHKVTVNKASQIVKFKEDFVIGEPITYVTRSGDEAVMKEVNKLNDAFFELGKFPHDKKLILWGLVCGLAHRYISTEKQGDIITRMTSMYYIFCEILRFIAPFFVNHIQMAIKYAHNCMSYALKT